MLGVCEMSGTSFCLSVVARNMFFADLVVGGVVFCVFSLVSGIVFLVLMSMSRLVIIS